MAEITLLANGSQGLHPCRTHLTTLYHPQKVRLCSGTPTAGTGGGSHPEGASLASQWGRRSRKSSVQWAGEADSFLRTASFQLWQALAPTCPQGVNRLSIHSFDKHLLSTYSVLGTLLGNEDTTMNKADFSPLSDGIYILGR